MRQYVEHALKSRPPVPRARDRWEEIQLIGRRACEKLPILADTSETEWSSVLCIISDLDREAANDLLDAFVSFNIRAVIKDNVLMVWTADLREESRKHRAEADASFMEMMRGR